jgi:hypothetical protein
MRSWLADYIRDAILGVTLVLGVLLLDVVVEVSIAARTVGLGLALLFAARYARRPWARSREGRHLMSFTLIVAAFLTYATVNNVISYFDSVPNLPDGQYPGRNLVGLVLYMLVAWELYQRNRLLGPRKGVNPEHLSGLYEGHPRGPAT